jgi:hypothetical protein
MGEEVVQDEVVDELPAEETPVESKFTLSPRMVAVAKGEDPDAISDEPVAEEVSEQEEVAEETDAPAEEQAEQPTSWVTDADRQQATAYGLDEADLATYTSREDFGRQLRAIDKAFSRRQPTWENSQVQKPEPETKAPAEAVDDTKPVDATGKLNLAYYEKNFSDDPDQLAVFKAIRKQQDDSEKNNAVLEEFRYREQEAEWNRHISAFHNAAETLRPDFYGRTVDKSGLPLSPSKSELDRRQKLFNAADVLIDHMAREQERNGLPVSIPPWGNILKQAESMAFPEEIAAHEKTAAKAKRQAELSKVAAQSKNRRPVGSTASAQSAYRNAPHADPHSTDAIMRNPSVEAVLRRITDGVSSN